MSDTLQGRRLSCVGAIDARNKIIHTGRHDIPHEELTMHVAALRELLKRIVLTLLNYQGTYISFLDGQETVTFPPTNTTITPDLDNHQP